MNTQTISYSRTAVEYTRVSTEEQRKGDSIQTQERFLKRYAKTNNMEILKHFSDNGFSGGDANRPAFQEMLQHLHNNPEIKSILVRDQDRLGRNALDLMELKMLLVQHKIELIIAEGQGVLDFKNPYTELLFGINAVTGEFFRKVTILRVKEGLARAKERGVVLGRPKKTLEKTKRLLALIKARAPITVIAELYEIDWKTAKREVERIKKEIKKEESL